MHHTHSQRSLGLAEEAIARSLLRYYFLSSRQICRLHYSAGSLTYVQSKMKALTDAGYCQRLWLPRPEPRGSAPSVFRLARRGLKHLETLGLEPRRFRPSEHRDHSYLFLAHTLAVNDVLIAAELLCRQHPALAMAALLHERDLKRTPVYVEHDNGTRVAVIPDGWLDLRVDAAYQVCLALELDMGTEAQKAWRRKVRGLVAYANGPYQDAFQTRSLTVAVVTTAGAKRMLDLLRWTERELEVLRERQQGDLFVMTSVNSGASVPADLFLGRRWISPFGKAAVALIAPD